MADEVTTAQASEAVEAGTPATAPEAVTEVKTFTQAELDSILKDRLKRAQDKAQADAAKAVADAEAKALAEQGNYKALYEKAEQDKKDALERATKLERAALQAQVAKAVGLPEALASRLVGDTEQDLEADAKAMLAALPKPAAPNINSGTGNGGAPVAGGLTDAQKAEWSAIYGVRIQ